MDMNNKTNLLTRTLAGMGTALTAGAAFAVTAFAESGSASTGTATAPNTTVQLLGSLIPFVIALVLLYLILLRPQQKREKEAQKMREDVRIGDEICTAGGIVGLVIKVTDDTVVIETGGERNKIRIKKWAIHENITQMEEAQKAEKERKAARQNGIAAAGVSDTKKKKRI